MMGDWMNATGGGFADGTKIV
eukprot:COSAG06_NODE_43351_length_372_cov_41.135531_1_plen_20_part_10